MQCSKIKTALPACFDKILVTHDRNTCTTKKVTFTSDLPLIPLYLTELQIIFYFKEYSPLILNSKGIFVSGKIQGGIL
jgi:hypothetical protein